MTVEVLRYEPDQWKDYAESAHKLIFRECRDASFDRISFALIAVGGGSTIGYVTCRELDKESLYWQFGGALDEFRGLKAVRGFQAFLAYSAARYKRVSTLVRNDNVGYLHMLMKMGFRAIGMRTFEGEIFLEMFWSKP